MNIIQEITIDLTNSGMPPRTYAMQGDAASRAVKINLKANGQAWDVPEGAVGVVRYKRQDGTGSSYDTTPYGVACVFGESDVTVYLSTNLLIVPGISAVTVDIFAEDANVSTFVFEVKVEKNPGFVHLKDGGFYLAGTVPDSGWEPFKYLGTDANGNVIAKDAPSGSGGSSQLIVTLVRETGVVSHSSTEIISHLNTGGTAVLRIIDSDTTWGEVPLLWVIGDVVTFADDTVYEDRVSGVRYNINADKTWSMEETVMTGGSGSGATAEQVAQIQANKEAIAEIQDEVVSGTLAVESQKYTITLALTSGGSDVIVLETDENDYPTKVTVNGVEKPWTVTGV